MDYLRNRTDERSKAVQEAVDKVVESVPEGTESVSLQPETMDELKNVICDILQEQESPEHACYVILFSKQPLGHKEEEMLEEILTNFGSGCKLWGDDEIKNKYQEDVDDFIGDYIGGSVVWNDDCFVNDRSIIINFDIDGTQGRVYYEDDIRKLMDALNHLLGGRYITSFSAF